MTNQHMFMIMIEGQEDDVVRQLAENLAKLQNATSIGYASLTSTPKDSVQAKSTALAKLPRLTSRQQQIVPLILDGLSNKRIARVLGLSHFTVRNHITGIFTAFDVGGRRELAGIIRGCMQPDMKVAA